MRRSIQTALLGLVLVTLVSACATGGAASGERVRTNPTLITEAEIAAMPGVTAYELVQRLRPRWLANRASRSFSVDAEVLVYQGQLRLGNIEALRNVSADQLARIRYLDATQAASQLPGLGTARPAGAIILEPKVGG